MSFHRVLLYQMYLPLVFSLDIQTYQYYHLVRMVKTVVIWVNYQFVRYLLLFSILFGHSRFDRHVYDSNIKITTTSVAVIYLGVKPNLLRQCSNVSFTDTSNKINVSLKNSRFTINIIIHEVALAPSGL